MCSKPRQSIAGVFVLECEAAIISGCGRWRFRALLRLQLVEALLCFRYKFSQPGFSACILHIAQDGP